MLLKLRNESLIDVNDKVLMEGYLIFRKSKLWWCRWLGDYGHVSLMIKKPNCWVWFDGSMGFHNVESYPKGTKWCSMFPNSSFYHVRVWRENYTMRVPHLFQPFTCVEAVKAFIGCKKWWVVFPKQLIKEVI